MHRPCFGSFSNTFDGGEFFCEAALSGWFVWGGVGGCVLGNQNFLLVLRVLNERLELYFPLAREDRQLSCESQWKASLLPTVTEMDRFS